VHGPAPVGYECSHRLGSGDIQGIERDMNPNNLCWERGAVNKSRGFCQMYHAARVKDIREENAVAGRTITETAIWELASIEADAVCSVVHGPNLCRYWHPSWGKPSPSVLSRAGPNQKKLPKGKRPMGRPKGSKDIRPRKSRGTADRMRVKSKQTSPDEVDLVSSSEEEEQEEQKEREQEEKEREEDEDWDI
jgi:hypothetical protein